MGKFFGQYLIDQGLVSKEQVVECLGIQLDRTPSLVTVLVRSNMLEAEKLYEALNIQIKTNHDLKVVLLEHKFVSEEQLQEAIEMQQNGREPLGSILVEKEYVTFESFKDKLSDFLEEKSGNSPKEVEKLMTEINGPEMTENSESTTTPTSGTLPKIEVGSIMGGGEEYTDVFGVAYEGELNGLCDQVAAGTQEATEWRDHLGELYQKVRLLKGTAKFINASVSETLLDVIEVAAIGLRKGEAKDALPLAHEFVPVARKGFELLVQLRDSIRDNQSEEKLWLDEGWKASFEEVFSQCQSFSEKTANRSEEPKKMSA